MQVERQRAFNTIIIPEEAFEELNTDYSSSPNIRRVGPIVQRFDEQPSDNSVRDRISRLFNVEFNQLIVTMLGGGIAADRTAQMQYLSGLFENRPRCLHLIVIWPNSTVAPGLFGWKNTKVVQTRGSLALCQVADLVVSAVGYNSFHELMFHRLPTIFVPQVARFMDDQERRARAASDRGLAETVLAHELLLLERVVTSVLDGGRGEEMRSALNEIVLPKPGNRTAAILIQEGALQ